MTAVLVTQWGTCGSVSIYTRKFSGSELETRHMEHTIRDRGINESADSVNILQLAPP